MAEKALLKDRFQGISKHDKDIILSIEKKHKNPSISEIARKFKISRASVYRHFKEHMLRHIEPVIFFHQIEDKKGEMKPFPFMHVQYPGEEMTYVPAAILCAAVNPRISVCQTASEIEEGKVHAGKVKKHVEEGIKAGRCEKDELKRQISVLETEYPGFKAVV